MCLVHEGERRLERAVLRMLKQVSSVSLKSVGGVLLAMERKGEQQTARPHRPAAAASNDPGQVSGLIWAPISLPKNQGC